MTTATFDLPRGYRVDPSTGAWCTLPWPSDPVAKAELLRSSLGPQIIAWAEGRTDEPGLIDYQTGKPWRFTDGQKRWLILWYSLLPNGRYRFRSGVKRGAKGTGKDPFGAAWCLIELIGPSLHDGWDSDGRPIGIRHGFPLVQVMSNSEAQSKDVLRVANAMLSAEARDYYDLDCGETRTIIKTGGRLEVPPSSEASAEGDPATAIMLNESHHMTESSGGHRVAAVARRNVGKSPATIQARMIEFTNAHRMGSDSVAEQSFNAWQNQLANPRLKQDILYDSIEADPSLRITDSDELLLAIRQAYMDAPWTDVERKVDEVMDTRTSVADSIRYYLNGLAVAEDAWVDPGRFDALAAQKPVEDREQVALFLDCSKSEDATALMACRLSDMHVITVGCWQKPQGWSEKRDGKWRVPRERVDATVREFEARFRLVWFGVDPSPAKGDDDSEALYWAPMIDKWHQDFRDRLTLWATPGHSSVLFDMRLSQPGASKRMRAFTEAADLVRRWVDEDDEPPFSHDGDPRLRTHVHNAKRRPNPWGTGLGKVSRDSSQVVDLAVAMVGAVMGARIALNSGKVLTGPGVTEVYIQRRW